MIKIAQVGMPGNESCGKKVRNTSPAWSGGAAIAKMEMSAEAEDAWGCFSRPISLRGRSRSCSRLKYSNVVPPDLSVFICQILLLTDGTYAHSQYLWIYFPLCTLNIQEGDPDFDMNECWILSNLFSASIDDDAMWIVFFSLLIWNIDWFLYS